MGIDLVAGSPVLLRNFQVNLSALPGERLVRVGLCGRAHVACVHNGHGGLLIAALRCHQIVSACRRQPNCIRTRQVSAKTLYIRAQLHGQEPKQQLADVPERRREGNELGQPNSIRARQGAVGWRKARAQVCHKSKESKKSCVRGFYSDFCISRKLRPRTFA